ncbi:MAG: hypothetical protein ABWY07_11565 [Burkholderiales bacterium]
MRTLSSAATAGGKGKIVMCLLAIDHDERSLFPRQMFLPMAGTTDGWNKRRRDIKAERSERVADDRGAGLISWAARALRRSVDALKSALM